MERRIEITHVDIDAAACKVFEWAAEGRSIAIVGPNPTCVREILVDRVVEVAKSAGWPPAHKPSQRELAWPRGNTTRLFDAEHPNSIRGMQFEKAWIYGVHEDDPIVQGLLLALRIGDAEIVATDCAATRSAPAPRSPHQSIVDLLEHFHYEHLPSHLAEVSAPFCDLARVLASTLEGPEATVAMRKLLESKDAAVRAKVVMTKRGAAG